MISFRTATVLLTLGLIGAAAGATSRASQAPQSGVGTQDATAIAQEPAAEPTLPAGPTFFCPMHPDITSAATGQCPICQMQLVAGNPLDTREYDLDFATTPAAVTAGAPFTIRLRVRDSGGEEAITSFEEMHDKRFHLFIISRDMSVFEHVHPEQRPNGTWELDARLPKPGYYTIVTDFMPTGGSPQVIMRPLITADSNGDAESDQVPLVPDTLFEQTRNGITARVEFEPKPLLAGEHGHLTYQLTDAATGEPVVDLQPYLGAFGHTLIMSEDQSRVVHSHPTPDLSNDISKGVGGPRVMFEGYFPVPGNYRAWTQFQRRDQITTFSFAFRVPTLEEGMRSIGLAGKETQR